MKNTLLIVDDILVNRQLLKKIFSDKYNIAEAGNGKEAVEVLREQNSDIIMVLLDVIMPGVDGFAVLDYMEKENMIGKIPVVLITGDGNKEIHYRAYDKGASDVIIKPFDSKIVRKRVDNIIDLYYHKNDLEMLLDEKIQEIKVQNNELKKMNERIIDALATIVEFRNLESGLHIQRVREFTRIILEALAELYPEYEMTAEKINLIEKASMLHDVGKIAIPDSILLKPAKLTQEEFEIMKWHTTKGGDIVDHVYDIGDEQFMECCRVIAQSHHERYDGKGYPDQMKGEEIPIAAQVVSLTDAYDALISERVYKQAYSYEKAYQMIMGGECGAYNPKILKCFEHSRHLMEQRAKELV